MCWRLRNTCSKSFHCPSAGESTEYLPGIYPCEKKRYGEACTRVQDKDVSDDQRQLCTHCNGNTPLSPIGNPTLNSGETQSSKTRASPFAPAVAGKLSTTSVDTGDVNPKIGPITVPGSQSPITDSEGRVPPCVPDPFPRQWTAWRESKPPAKGWDSKGSRYENAVKRKLWVSYWCPLPYEPEDKYYDRQQSLVQLQGRTQGDLEDVYWDWRDEYPELEPHDKHSKRRINRINVAARRSRARLGDESDRLSRAPSKSPPRNQFMPQDQAGPPGLSTGNAPNCAYEPPQSPLSGTVMSFDHTQAANLNESRRLGPTSHPLTSIKKLPYWAPEDWRKWNETPASANDLNYRRYFKALKAYPRCSFPLPSEPKEEYIKRQRDQDILQGRTEQSLSEDYDTWMRDYPGLRTSTHASDMNPAPAKYGMA